MPLARPPSRRAKVDGRRYAISPVNGYSIHEAAEVLGVPQRRIRELVARGVIAGSQEDDGELRVYLQPRSAPSVQAETRADPAFEASPFRELLTEFRNLTERYGQALLALGESRGEVAALRGRVEAIEARMDLRLPGSAAAPPVVEWHPPLPAPAESEAPDAAVDSTSAEDSIVVAGDVAVEVTSVEPDVDESEASVEPETASELGSVQAEQVKPARNHRSGFRQIAVGGFAEALARAMDPSTGELPEPVDAPESPGVAEVETVEAASNETEESVERGPAIDTERYSTEIEEPDWLAEGEFVWLDAAEVETREADTAPTDDATAQPPPPEAGPAADPLEAEPPTETEAEPEVPEAEPEVPESEIAEPEIAEPEPVGRLAEAEAPAEPIEPPPADDQDWDDDWDSEPAAENFEVSVEEEITVETLAPNSHAAAPVTGELPDDEMQEPGFATKDLPVEDELAADAFIAEALGDEVVPDEPSLTDEEPGLVSESFPETHAEEHEPAGSPIEGLPEEAVTEEAATAEPPKEEPPTGADAVEESASLTPAEPQPSPSAEPEATDASPPVPDATGEVALMWLGSEFDERDDYAAELEFATAGWHAEETSRQPSQDELTRIAHDQGWDATEVDAIRNLLEPPSHGAEAGVGNVTDEATARPTEAASSESEAEDAEHREAPTEGEAASTPAPYPSTDDEQEAPRWPEADRSISLSLPGGDDLQRALAALGDSSQAPEPTADERATPESATVAHPVRQRAEPRNWSKAAAAARASQHAAESAESPAVDALVPEQSGPAASEPPRSASEAMRSEGGPEWLKGRRDPAARAYRRLRRIFPR